MQKYSRLVNPAAASFREYLVLLWGTAALVAVNVALALPTGAAKVQDVAAIEKGISGKGAKLIDNEEGGDDIMTELAAAPVASGELSKLRGGFRTRSGIDIAVGFDFKTFLNGQLKVHNIFNVVGGQANNRGTNKSVVTGPSNTILNGNNGFKVAIPVTIAKAIVPAMGGNIDKTVNTATNVATPATTPPVSDATGPAQVPSVEPIVINQVAEGNLTLVNEVGLGTKVTNTLNGGSANTFIENAASGVTIDQVTSLSIAIAMPENFISGFKSGRPVGLGLGVSNVWRSALIGSIAR